MIDFVLISQGLLARSKQILPVVRLPTEPYRSTWTLEESCVFTEESEEVRSPVDLRHWCIRVVSQDVCILWPLKFVEKLRPQHYVEIFPDSSHDFIHSKLPKWQKKPTKNKSDMTNDESEYEKPKEWRNRRGSSLAVRISSWFLVVCIIFKDSINVLFGRQVEKLKAFRRIYVKQVSKLLVNMWDNKKLEPVFVWWSGPSHPPARASAPLEFLL